MKKKNQLSLNKKRIMSLSQTNQVKGGDSTQLPCVSDMTVVNCLSKVYLCGDFNTWINCGTDVKTYHKCTIATN